MKDEVQYLVNEGNWTVANDAVMSTFFLKLTTPNSLQVRVTAGSIVRVRVRSINEAGASEFVETDSLLIASKSFLQVVSTSFYLNFNNRGSPILRCILLHSHIWLIRRKWHHFYLAAIAT